MTRLLFLGDSAGTGFGTVTKDLGTALLALGVDVRFVSLNEQPVELEEPFAGRTATLGLPDGWLSASIAKAKSTDPVKVAKAMEGLSVKSFSGEITMRASDHQLQQTLYLATWQKVDKKNPVNVEKTGNTWVAEKVFEPYVASTPTTGQMKRPG